MATAMRLLRHLFARPAGSLFPADSLQRIAQAVAEAERDHRGEICFAVEPALPVQRVVARTTARERAHEAFAQLRVWDTEANNGVLLYLLLADHRIEIVADRGLDGRVSEAEWRGICALVEDCLRAGEAEAAAMAGVRAVSALLARHFPRFDGDVDVNELPDAPRLL